MIHLVIAGTEKEPEKVGQFFFGDFEFSFQTPHN